jgi:hypothetical protein
MISAYNQVHRLMKFQINYRSSNYQNLKHKILIRQNVIILAEAINIVLR